MCADITALKDIVVALAAATTATVAIIGLNRWFKELKGRTYFDTSRAILRAAFLLREEVRRCRSRLIQASEFPAEDGSQTEDNTDFKAYAHVYANRWDPVRKAAIEFDATLIEGEVLWGGECREIGSRIQGHTHQLFVSIQSYLEEKRADPNTRDKDFMKSLRAILHGDSDDEWFKKFEADVIALEAFLGKHLGRYS